MWLNRRTEEPSVTDSKCYWKKPRLSGIGTSKAFTLAAEIRVGKKAKTVTKPTNQSAINDLPDNSTFLGEVVNKLIEKKVDVQLSKYKIGFDQVYDLSIHQIVMKFLSEDNTTNDDFLTYTRRIVTDTLCNDAEKRTLEQSENILW